MITTKRGKTGLKPTINVSYNHSFAQPTRIVKMADAATYATARNWANITKGLEPTYTEEEIRKFADGSDPLNYPNTDWYRTVQKHGLTRTKPISLCVGEARGYSISCLEVS